MSDSPRIKNPVLVSYPRSGSSWVKKFIDIHNGKNVTGLGDVFGSNRLIQEGKTTEDWITFLEEQRAIGNEYSIKYFSYHDVLLNHMEWWTEFYKDSTIITLERRDTWRMFLSYLVQKQTGWQYHNAKSQDDIKSFESKIKKVNVSIEDMNEWADRYNTFKALNLPRVDIQLYYEDLSDEYLRELFNVDKSPKYIPYKEINYEQYVLNIDEVREYHRECTNLKH